MKLFRRSPSREWELARSRWRRTGPTPRLTWGEYVSGHAFVVKLAAHGGLGPDRTLLEIGPGYGRVLGSILNTGQPFRAYVGLDLSRKNVAALRQIFAHPSVRFQLGDAETDVPAGGPFDTAFASLTFKHLYPTFEAAARNLGQHLRPGALLVFDLLESETAQPGAFHRNPEGLVSYLRRYTRAEATATLEEAGFVDVAFDAVDHAPGFTRLLTIARRP